MNQKNLEEIIIEVKGKTLNFLSHKPRSYKEIDNRINYYLKRYEDLEISQKEEINRNVIEGLERADLIDDDRYAQSLVNEKINSSKPMSRLKIRQFLMKKGIDSATIDFALENFTEEQEIEKIMEVATKKASQIKETNHFKKKQKLLSYLATKGYPLSKVYAVVDRVLDVK
ncbi:regulatory protein RecX [Patescibacteria group bacterium]